MLVSGVLQVILFVPVLVERYVYIHTDILCSHFLNFLYMCIYTHSLVCTYGLSSVLAHSLIHSRYHMMSFSLSPKFSLAFFKGRECLLAKALLTFCLSGNVFYSLSFWKDSFTDTELLVKFFLFFLPSGLSYF